MFRRRTLEKDLILKCHVAIDQQEKQRNDTQEVLLDKQPPCSKKHGGNMSPAGSGTLHNTVACVEATALHRQNALVHHSSYLEMDFSCYLK